MDLYMNLYNLKWLLHVPHDIIEEFSVNMTAGVSCDVSPRSDCLAVYRWLLSGDRLHLSQSRDISYHDRASDRLHLVLN